MGFKLSAVLASVFLLAGCVTGGQPVKIDPITVTAETAAAVADRAVRTNALYKQFCPTGQIDAKACEQWAEFYPQFKDRYAQFYLAYKQAIAAGDATTAQGLAKSLEAVSDQLLMFYLVSQKGSK